MTTMAFFPSVLLSVFKFFYISFQVNHAGVNGFYPSCALSFSFTFSWSTTVDLDTKDMSPGEWPIRLKSVFVCVFFSLMATKCSLQDWSQLTGCDLYIYNHNLCYRETYGGMNSSKIDI